MPRKVERKNREKHARTHTHAQSLFGTVRESDRHSASVVG
jgi:hypothetical protein